VATALLAALALMLLVTWWRAPFVHIEGRMGNSIYDSEGTVVLAYALFALGLGVAIGAVWRRAVPALVVTFAGYFAVRVFGDTWLRQRLLTPVSATWDVRRSSGRDLSTAWVIEQHPVDAHGHALKEFSCPHNRFRHIGESVGAWKSVRIPAAVQHEPEVVGDRVRFAFGHGLRELINAGDLRFVFLAAALKTSVKGGPQRS
jgi:hypothetical protein